MIRIIPLPGGPAYKIEYTAAAVACHGLGGGGWLAGAVFFEKVCLVKGKFLYLADINAFAFSPLNLSNPLIFRIVKYAKVMEVNR